MRIPLQLQFQNRFLVGLLFLTRKELGLTSSEQGVLVKNFLIMDGETLYQNNRTVRYDRVSSRAREIDLCGIILAKLRLLLSEDMPQSIAYSFSEPTEYDVL